MKWSETTRASDNWQGSVGIRGGNNSHSKARRSCVLFWIFRLFDGGHGWYKGLSPGSHAWRATTRSLILTQGGVCRGVLKSTHTYIPHTSAITTAGPGGTHLNPSTEEAKAGRGIGSLWDQADLHSDTVNPPPPTPKCRIERPVSKTQKNQTKVL